MAAFASWSQARRQGLQFGILLIGLLLLNFFGQQYFTRIDLTEDGRYSISPATQRLLSELEGELTIKVYLEGKFPPGFKRLQTTVKETLDEFQRYAGNRLKVRYIDPSQANNEEERKQNYLQLVQKGINPTNIFANEDGKRVEKLIFPGAVLSYTPPIDKDTNQYEATTLLFRTIDQRMPNAPSPDEILNQSIENVEYHLASAIQRLVMDEEKRKNIGFLQGHGEAPDIRLADLLTTLSQTYNVFKVDLPQQSSLEGLDAIVIAKPDTAYSDKEKYKIDQYIMSGGKALFFLDAVGVYMDSVLRDKGSFTFPYDHNLTDMLFKYGVYLEPKLIKDLNAGFIPMVTGNMGDQTQVQPIPWHYYPLVNTFAPHPIVRNLDAVYTKFVTKIDTVKAVGIRKTPLMFTSRYSALRGTPAFITFNEARVEPNPAQFSAGPQPIAYLLEGRFTSLFKNRITPQDPRRASFREQGQPTKVLVCTDGDLIQNDITIDKASGKPQPLPLGFDRYSRRTFANKEFVVNAIDYMLDEEGVISARAKEVILRPLDKVKLKEERLYWQTLNMGLPVLLLWIFGGVWFLARRRMYARQG
jgi:gliding-associated putative ABC transporter substrate-binding component GldG